jgi:putative NADH-flavin reductase
MNVVLFGATGMIGSRILAELVSRGHHVTAAARDTSKISPNANVKAVEANILHPHEVAAAAHGMDAMISAFNAGMEHPAFLVTATRSLIGGAKAAHVKRLLAISGTGALFSRPGVRMVDEPDFSEYWRPTARAHSDALDELMASGLEWTAISPPPLIQPGRRTGRYRLGTDYIVEDAHGNSHISAEDFAVAMVDELEKPEHIGKRFTVGY